LFDRIVPFSVLDRNPKLLESYGNTSSGKFGCFLAEGRTFENDELIFENFYFRRQAMTNENSSTPFKNRNSQISIHHSQIFPLCALNCTPSLCDLCVFCVSVVSEVLKNHHHRGTENTEIAQRKSLSYSEDSEISEAARAGLD